VILERTTILRAPLADVFRFFSDTRNLARITPPSMHFRVLSAPDRPLREGDRTRYQLRVAGVPVSWTTLITECRENEAFTDEQERGPYRLWRHTHSFRELEPGVVEMHDRVEYELPLGILGRFAAGWFVRRQLREVFDHRAAAIRDLFEIHP
jgi:ligand-binding SRPBCC domain-containing protein